MTRVSVLMSVYNGEPWVRQAIESVLVQTFSDFEFFVVDDGSTDGTAGVLDACSDPRLRIFHQPRVGLTRSLNRTIPLAAAPLVARMDADDMSHPERFARQVAFLDAHPEVGLLGTGCETIAPSGEVIGTVAPLVDDAAIRRALIRMNPFVHSSVMVRRQILEEAGGYDESLPVAQDYDLWLRMSRLTRMANLPEPLVQRRLTPGRVSNVLETDRLRAEVRAKVRALQTGAYPLWCAVFLAKPILSLALPVAVRRRLRPLFSRERSERAAFHTR